MKKYFTRQYKKKSHHVHKAPPMRGSKEESNHIESIVRNLILHYIVKQCNSSTLQIKDRRNDSDVVVSIKENRQNSLKNITYSQK